jgi:hypothetical protein
MDDDYILRADLALVLNEPASAIAAVLKRGGFDLPDADYRSGTGNWVKFSMADVATLAMLRSLTALGMQIGTAAGAVNAVVYYGEVELDDLERFIARWRRSRMVVARDERDWSFMMVDEDSINVEYPPACVVMDVARIVDDAVTRARSLAARRAELRRMTLTATTGNDTTTRAPARKSA